VVRWLVAEWRSLPVESPESVPQVEKRTADLIEPLSDVVGGDPLARDLKLMLDLMRVEPGLPSWSGDHRTSWSADSSSTAMFAALLLLRRSLISLMYCALPRRR
jgi:hypothetical protein